MKREDGLACVDPLYNTVSSNKLKLQLNLNMCINLFSVNCSELVLENAQRFTYQYHVDVGQ